jgi:hypothetical protein
VLVVLGEGVAAAAPGIAEAGVVGGSLAGAALAGTPLTAAGVLLLAVAAG